MASATLVMLGSGTSNGVPMLGHPYPPGYLDEPKNWRTRSSVCLLGPMGNLLVDCAPEMRLQMTREGILDVEAVLVTHTHADHVMGMDDLRSLCLKYGRKMPVYTLPRHMEDIRRIYPYAFVDGPQGVWLPQFDLRDVGPGFEAGGMRVRTFVVPHGPTPVIGLRVGDLAYLTDVSEIPDEVRPLLDGLETLILDAVRYAPHPNHFHYERAIAEAQRVGARQTYFTHLSHDYDHNVVNHALPAAMRLAFDGLRIKIRL